MGSRSFYAKEGRVTGCGAEVLNRQGVSRQVVSKRKLEQRRVISTEVFSAGWLVLLLLRGSPDEV